MSTNKNKQPLNITVYGKQITQVTEFIFLGHKLSSAFNGSVAVQHRIGLGWAAFEKNKEILTSNRVWYGMVWYVRHSPTRWMSRLSLALLG